MYLLNNVYYIINDAPRHLHSVKFGYFCVLLPLRLENASSLAFWNETSSGAESESDILSSLFCLLFGSMIKSEEEKIYVNTQRFKK